MSYFHNVLNFKDFQLDMYCGTYGVHYYSDLTCKVKLGLLPGSNTLQYYKDCWHAMMDCIYDPDPDIAYLKKIGGPALIVEGEKH